jgi:preprotein translocase subunit SecG
MFKFLLIVQTLIAASLVGVILMQRSEGGGLGVGGSSSGFMTARGAADFLTRATAVLGGLFIVLSIVLAAIAGASREPVKVDTSLANQMAPVVPQQQGAPATQQPAQQQPSPAQNQNEPAVPLAQ